MDQQATSRDGYHLPARQPKRNRQAAAPYPHPKFKLYIPNRPCSAVTARAVLGRLNPPVSVESICIHTGMYRYGVLITHFQRTIPISAVHCAAHSHAAYLPVRVFPRRAGSTPTRRRGRDSRSDQDQLQDQDWKIPFRFRVQACATARPGRNVLSRTHLLESLAKVPLGWGRGPKSEPDSDAEPLAAAYRVYVYARISGRGGRPWATFYVF